ncbi:ribosomal-protein-alanine N-acetyltransferase [Pelolinea submarina]|nr:ribosomal-protein-alanine N-acetyltransferase [Pelolinea submarina]
MLICTAEPDEVFWIRIFGTASFSQIESQWEILFGQLFQQLPEQPSPVTLASIAYFDWMKNLLDENGWRVQQEVVQLRWVHNYFNKLEKKWPEELSIRPMTYNDIKTVTEIDQDCFLYIWKQSQDVIRRAFEQSSYTTVAVIENEVVGFQISTSHKSIAHLARLAVLPKFQGQHIGQALVQNMLRHYSRPWIQEITVNTQHDNQVSLSLYAKMGFEPTGERFPIFTYQKS